LFLGAARLHPLFFLRRYFFRTTLLLERLQKYELSMIDDPSIPLGTLASSEQSYT